MTSCATYSIDDIEDIGNSSEIDGINQRSGRTNVKIRGKIAKNGLKNGFIIENQNDCSENNDDGCIEKNDLIAEEYKIYLKTWGCSHNSSDSEYMAGILNKYGFQLTENKNIADLWLLNSCTVKAPAETHFRTEVEEGQKLGKYVVIAGCVPQAAPKNEYIKGLSIIGVQQIDRVIEVVEETLKGNTVRLMSTRKENGKKAGGSSLFLPKIRKNPIIEIIPISTGCLNQCTYCKTKHARGKLGSYSIEEIVSRAGQAFSEGVKEIWLTSEDTGAYGIDLGLTIIDLLKELVKVIPHLCFIRIGMTNPPYILDHLEEMSKILSHPRVYSFLHIPVQSGSDCVLGDMKREYCIEDFERIVDYIREKVPGCTIATDIICGFPTETEKDFDETMQLCQKYNFPSLFINQFYPRPGTPAAKMEKIPAQKVKLRTKKLSDYFLSYENYESSRIGTIYNILITEISHDQLHFVGHNKFYEQILIPMNTNPDLMGKFVTVKIVSCSKFSMTGKILQEKENIQKVVNKNETEGQTSRNNFSLSLLILICSIFLYLFLKFYL